MVHQQPVQIDSSPCKAEGELKQLRRRRLTKDIEARAVALAEQTKRQAEHLKKLRSRGYIPRIKAEDRIGADYDVLLDGLHIDFVIEADVDAGWVSYYVKVDGILTGPWKRHGCVEIRPGRKQSVEPPSGSSCYEQKLAGFLGIVDGRGKLVSCVEGVHDEIIVTLENEGPCGGDCGAGCGCKHAQGFKVNSSDLDRRNFYSAHLGVPWSYDGPSGR